MNIIIVSHGELSKGIKNSAEMIAGKVNNVTTFSLKPGESPDEIAKTIENMVIEKSNEEFVILADILGGSVYNACLKLALYNNVRIISGINLSIVVEVFLTLSDEKLDEKIEEIILRAKDGIKVMNAKKMLQKEEDEEWLS